VDDSVDRGPDDRAVAPRDLEALAERVGEPVEELRRWAEAGLLRAGETEAQLLERARVVHLLRRRGLDVSALAAASRAEPGLLDRYIDVFAPKGELHPLDEAAAARGLDPALARRLLGASGLADRGDLCDADDVAALAAMAVAIEAGFPPEAMVQLLRVYGDALSRIAEAEARLFHFHVHEQLRADGLSGDQLDIRTAAGIRDLLPLVEPSVAYFHRKALARAVREDLALHFAEDAGLVQAGDTSGRVDLTIAFVDLSRFTPMTEAMGDLAAAGILDRFSELVRHEVHAAGGRVVKQIGDEFMLVFSDPVTAVRAALEIRHATEREPAFLATRIGVHHGSVLCREADYIGAAVNLAARITGQAAPHEVLVSAVVADAAATLDDVTFAAAGTRPLKGIDDQVLVYQAEWRSGPLAHDHRIDPVCGMVVDADRAPARLQVDGEDLAFCSESCLRRYLADGAES